MSVIRVVATPRHSDVTQQLSYMITATVGKGSFGVVHQAQLCDPEDGGAIVAIKRVLQDRRFKNRELQIMRKLDHLNIVPLLYHFYSTGVKHDEVYLNLVLEFVPEIVYRSARGPNKCHLLMPSFLVKLYVYQMFRGLAYLHSIDICHRDVKPHNLLINSDRGVLKICDFGSAKILIPGESNISYICSRYYRAPELIFGSSAYSCQIDIWSAGCVLAELLLGQAIFLGDNGVDQLVEIIKVLGTPTQQQIHEMNPSYAEFEFPVIRRHPWNKVFRPDTEPDVLDFISKLLDYIPHQRLRAIEALTHSYFADLRRDGVKLPNGRDLPPLFNFSPAELSLNSDLKTLLKLPSAVTNHSTSSAEVKSTN